MPIIKVSKDLLAFMMLIISQGLQNLTYIIKRGLTRGYIGAILYTVKLKTPARGGGLAWGKFRTAKEKA